MPSRFRAPSDKSPQNFFRPAGGIKAGLLRGIIVLETTGSAGRSGQVEIRVITRYAIPTPDQHFADPGRCQRHLYTHFHALRTAGLSSVNTVAYRDGLFIVF